MEIFSQVLLYFLYRYVILTSVYSDDYNCLRACVYTFGQPLPDNLTPLSSLPYSFCFSATVLCVFFSFHFCRFYWILGRIHFPAVFVCMRVCMPLVSPWLTTLHLYPPSPTILCFQLSFLIFPTTTFVDFIGFFFGDKLSSYSCLRARVYALVSC